MRAKVVVRNNSEVGFLHLWCKVRRHQIGDCIREIKNGDTPYED